MDCELLATISRCYKYLFTIEDGVVVGGFGTAVLEIISGLESENRVIRLGIPDKFVTHGTIAQLQDDCGYSPRKIAQKVREVLGVR